MTPNALRRSLVALTLGIAALVPVASASAAVKVEVFAKAIDNPRGLALGPNGTLYVASAGRAGPTCLDKKKETCAGFSSRVLAVSPNGTRRNVAKGLISVGSGAGLFATGANAVSVGPDGRIFTVTTSGPPEQINGVPTRFRTALGRLFEITSGTPRALARIDAFEFANNADRVKGDRNSNPYGVLALADRQIVADAGANDLLSVDAAGTVSLLAVIPKNGKADSVPTSLALGPDGAVYAGELALGAAKGKARVWRVPLDGTAPSVFATGFTAITGIAFGPDGSLYVTEFTTDPKEEVAPGAVVRRRPDGSTTTLKRRSLVSPTGTAVGADGAVYVSNASILPSRTPKRSPFKGAGGHVIKITGF